MKNLFAIISLFLIATNAWSQSTIALWNYDGITGTPATPTANVGSGTSLKIGSFVVATAATGMDPVLNDGCGTQNGLNPGAWAFTANPGSANESSGVQYNASTVGYSNIVFTWDQRSSNTAVNTVRLQYTLDGTIWTNFTMTATNTTFCLGELNDGRFQNSTAGDSYRRISVNLSAISGANNNANFGVRILAAHFQTSGAFRATVVQTNTASNTGTMRFDNVSFKTQAANVIPADVSIAAASNVAKYAESIGLVNVPITVANANSTAINLTFGLSVYSDATQNADYTWTNTLTIPANTNGISNLPITIIDDLLAEKAERIVVKLLSGTNATISATSNYQIIFIKDNDYVAPTSSNELNLSLLTSFSNGATGTNSAEIVSFDPTVDRLYIANSIGRKLDIINFSNPSSPQLISSISMVPYGNINSVTTNNGLVALAIENIDPQANGSVVFLNSNGEFIKQVAVGAMPDMITFNKTFTKILTANEGEPNMANTVDPEGSVSIIDLSPGIANLTDANVTNIGFTAFNSQRASLVSQGIRVFSSSLTVAQDLEPEYITISDDNTKAFVGIQEANALLTINLTNNSIISLTALGYSSYGSGSNNALDASDLSGEILITGNLPIKGAYMPDALAFGTIAGQGYIFSANEGDGRELTSIIDANRISSTTFANLDATAFPDAAILKNTSFLGRLNALKYSGDTDGDGDYDELHVMSGRSFSIWNATTGALVYDSKDLIEQIISKHPVFSAIFNASNTTGTPSLKNRSDDKGPEVEGIAFQMISGKPYAFVSLERVGGIMIFNVENPTNPIYVGYANNRSTTVSGPDLGAEGIITISAEDSPNGNNIVILANEISSTLSIYQLNSCATAAGGVINASSNVICSGSSTTLSIPGSTGSTYQWQLNGQEIPNATGTQYSASSAGSYSVLVTSSILGCSGVSASKNIIAVSPISNSVSASINSGQTYTFGTQNLTSPGTYNNVFASVNNCDSTVTLNLTVNPENYGDTIVFDLNQGVYSSENGINYFTYPVNIKSTYTAINSFDFWFKFNETKLTFVSSNSTLNGLDVFSNFNSNNHYLSTTASMPSISNTIPANTNIMELKFIVNGPCPEVNTNDFFNSNSLINGVICVHRFSLGIPRTAVINTTTASACGSYVWNGTTFTASGIYTGTTANCVTQSLNLTITPLQAQPTGLSCWQTASFNEATCSWVISGTQAVQPILACYQTAVFNTTLCSWVVSGTQAAQPTTACYQTASFNAATCSWVISGTQAAQPTLACYQIAAFNTTSCAWDVTGTQAAQPTLACYQTAVFNTTSCAWDVSGTQVAQPTLACYQTATFNTTSCTWVVTGTAPAAPSNLACYQTATFNTTTCAWDVSGTQALNTIIQTAMGSYTWANNGQTYTASGTYTGVVENCITQVLNLTITPFTATLSLEVFLDGYYVINSNPSSMRPARYNNLVASGSTNTGSSTDVDIITVELRSPSNLDVVAYSVSPILQANGSVQCVFPAAAIGATYYIVVNHRSSLRLWSANPVTMSVSTALNFSNNITNVYTNGSISPMKTLVSGLYASRLGELIEDGYLDGMDYSAFESDAYSSAYGNLYLLDGDLNGDSYVDASDFAVYDFNSQLGSYEQRPY